MAIRICSFCYEHVLKLPQQKGLVFSQPQKQFCAPSDCITKRPFDGEASKRDHNKKKRLQHYTQITYSRVTQNILLCCFTFSTIFCGLMLNLAVFAFSWCHSGSAVSVISMLSALTLSWRHWIGVSSQQTNFVNKWKCSLLGFKIEDILKKSLIVTHFNFA